MEKGGRVCLRHPGDGFIRAKRRPVVRSGELDSTLRRLGSLAGTPPFRFLLAKALGGN
jgi:hypothetical protein